MLNIEKAKFDTVVKEAKTKSASDPACLRAIERFVEQVETNPYLQYENGELLCAGSSTNQIYRANGVCQCPAFNSGKLCWHRVGAKLMKRYQESLGLRGENQGEEAATVGVSGLPRAGKREGITASSRSRLQEGIYCERNGRAIRTVTCDGWQV